MLNACAVEPSQTPPTTTSSERPDMDAVEKELAELSSHLDAATHRQLTLIRWIDESEHWARQGARSCAHWLNWRIGLNLGAAREKLRVAHALAELPAIDEALRKGEISYAKARAMTRVAKPKTETKLLEMAQSSTASQLERICRGVRRAEEDEPGAVKEEAERFVRVRHRGEPTVRFEAELLPDEAERLMEAIRAMRQKMKDETVGEDGGPSPTMADALVRIAEVTLANEKEARESMRTAGAERAQLLVHLTPDALNEGYRAELDDGTYVSAETLRRLACDCSMLSVLRNAEGGSILDIGRKTRKVPTAIARAVRLRDRCCAFPGCTNEGFLELHHSEHWMHGGKTSMQNLVLLCTFHHRFVHEGGWRVEMKDGITPIFLQPDGTVFERAPKPPDAPDDPLRTFEEQHADLAIHEETGLTRWDGTPPDYAACVMVACGPSEHGLRDDELGMNASEWLAANGYRDDTEPRA